ncbi:hypothetical protein SteCoe_19296 [Stentor coeruleus]|uniref:Palmitoyltransferase n=1 Tax=Stentor coeruleus TaxID=5963 RepID=A0A1R2BV39_9CILI|nr:hypothetical protein SteCoe_19296 [Stentor coeruleus]
MFARKNGLSCPWSLKQALSYFGFIVYGLSYNLVIVTKTQTDYQTMRTIIFNFLCFLSISSHIVTSLIDPGDPLLYKGKSINHTEGVYLRCAICNSAINLFSRHCVTCNKCVYKYDHHCQWVNNCIGSKNYKSFFVLIITCTLMSALITSSSITATFITFSNEQNSNAEDEQGYASFVIFLGIFSLLGVIYFGYIATFHSMMLLKGVTTYEYVCRKRAMNNHKIIPRIVIDKESFSMHTDMAGISFGN